MISKTLAIKVLNEALKTGGDYAEIYFENSISQSISLENGKVDGVNESQGYGAGLRILKGLKSVYGYTSDLSPKSLLSLASKLAASYEGERAILVTSIKKERVRILNKVEDHLTDVPASEKLELLKEAAGIISNVDKRIVRVMNGFSNYRKIISVFAADSSVAKRYDNVEERGRLSFLAVASEEGRIESYYAAPGHYDGWRYFKDVLPWRDIAREVGEKAIKTLDAKECPSGRYPVVISNGWGGVIFHEACGHSLEATATAKGLSVFSNSIGKQIASPIVSAFDDGTMPNEWGSNNIDSEGHKTQKNQLIKDGICVGFLVDKFNARRLNMEPNGCSGRSTRGWRPAWSDR